MKPAKATLKASLIAAALSACILPSIAQAGNACMTADEAAAERVRRLQTSLMIGALQCRNHQALKVAETYNRVVKRYGAVISAHNQILTRYFQRTEGAGYRQAMDRHVTSMANMISRAAQRDPGYCANIAALGNEMLSPAAADIVDKARWAQLVDVNAPPACESNRSMTAQSTATASQ